MAQALTQPPKFHLFNHLPYEIRLQIWELALNQPQTIEVILDNPCNNVSTEVNGKLLPLQNPHPLLQACYESFKACRPHLRPLRITPKITTRSLEIPVRVGAFILYLHPSNMIVYHSDLCDRNAPVEMLAVNYTRDSVAESVSLVRRFGSVHTLYVVLNDKWTLDASMEGRVLDYTVIDNTYVGSFDVTKADMVGMTFLQKISQEMEFYPEGWLVPEVKCVLVSRRITGSRTKL